jgi:hypothetical protein
LSKKLTQFDKEDVKLLDEMLSKFAAYKRGDVTSDGGQGRVVEEYRVPTKGSGLPDYSASYVAYFPILAVALLKSQRAVQTLTWVLVGLTAVLAVLTGFVTAAM